MKKNIRETLQETAGAIYIAAAAVNEEMPELSKRMTEYTAGLTQLCNEATDADLLTDYERVEIAEALGAVWAINNLPIQGVKIGEYYNILTQVLAEDEAEREAKEDTEQ